MNSIIEKLSFPQQKGRSSSSSSIYSLLWMQIMIYSIIIQWPTIYNQVNSEIFTERQLQPQLQQQQQQQQRQPQIVAASNQHNKMNRLPLSTFLSTPTNHHFNLWKQFCKFNYF